MNHEVHNKDFIQKKLRDKSIDWKSIVKVSTAHYVLPALYCKLKQANFLEYLPKDLVAFMEHITHLNRERNIKIIEQALKINNLLIKNGIKPIFIKGTGNLIEGLYDDIAERMTGDIDFIVAKNEYQKTIDILKNDGYHRTEKNLIGFHKHYPRLIKENSIAAIEIHKDFFDTNFARKFNYETIKDAIQKNGLVHVLSFQHQFYLTILAYQINDHGYELKSISLRSAYDTFLLSKKIAPNALTPRFGKKTNTIIYCYLALVNHIFNNISSLNVLETKKNKIYVERFNKSFFYPQKKQSLINFVEKRNRQKYLLNLMIKALYRKKYTLYVFKKTIEKFR